MFIPRITRPTCAHTWLAASKAVQLMPGHEGHNILMDVHYPTTVSEQDTRLARTVDSFLLSKGKFPISTVANTIFPQATFETHGSPAFYEVYLKKIFPRLKRSPRDWGRYFERMVSYPTLEGPQNLLGGLVEDMKKYAASDRTYKNVYELPIYNPALDRTGSPIGRQCLSYLSFKLDSDGKLLLAAIYRNHFYTEKLLGNLIGLGRLMAFVAGEAGVRLGSLSVLSTHASVDTAGATQGDLKALHDQCEEILAPSNNLAKCEPVSAQTSR